MLAYIICYWKMTSFMVLDSITSFLRLKGVTNTGKRMGHGLSIGGSSSVLWRKVGRSCMKTSNVFLSFCVC